MAFTFSVNHSPVDTTDGMFKFLTAAKLAGWTVVTSSDGISSYPSAITQSRISTGGLQNPKAWFVIQQPGGSTRQLSIQRSADGTGTNYNFRILYSPVAGFVGGSPGIIQTPTATDEVLILGGGNEATPTFAAFSTPGADTNRLHLIFGDSSVNYGFATASFQIGTSSGSSAFMLDMMLAGSYPSADLDPVMIYQSSSVSAIYGVEMRNGAANTLKGFLGSLLSSAFVTIEAPLYSVGDGQIFPGNLGSNTWSGKEDILPAYYTRTTTPFGFKGFSSLLSYIGTPRGSTDLISVTNPKDHLCVTGALLPWPTGVDILI